MNAQKIATAAVVVGLGLLGAESARAASFGYSTVHLDEEFAKKYSYDDTYGDNIGLRSAYINYEGLKITLTAYPNDGRTLYVDDNGSYQGIGIEQKYSGDSKFIDGAFTTEYIGIHFDHEVDFYGIFLDGTEKESKKDDGDDLQFYVGSNFEGRYDLDFKDGDGWVFFDGIKGSDFYVSAEDWNDDFYLRKLKYKKVEAIPEPVTILGSAVALGIGGVLRRKKSEQ